MKKNNIILPYKNDNKCKGCLVCDGNLSGECQRKKFINECLPLIDIKESKINILNWDKSGYIWYDSMNTESYYFDNNFNLNKYDGNIIEEQFYDQDKLLENIDKQLVIKIESDLLIEIPIYYFFVNKNNIIFNIFISYYLYKNPSHTTNTILSFNYDTVNNNYISSTYKFDIFNLSLLCDKFFQIIPLFLYNYDENTIKKQLKNIFNKFALDKLYNIINYYKAILNAYNSNSEKDIKIKEIYPFEKFILSDIKSFPNVNYKKYKNATKIHNLESGKKKDKSLEEIYNELTNSILEYRFYLNGLTEIIPDFDKIFISSILDFRLKQYTIMNTWEFDRNFNIKFILNNLETTNIKKEDLHNIYFIEKPVIYEYSTVTYKGKTYGNCMENTLLQFLKILLWDDKIKNYSLNLIDNFANKNVSNKLLNIFKNIEKEKTLSFDYEWVKFIMELQETQDNKFGNYDLLTNDIELNPTLQNLIIFLKYISVQEISDIDNNEKLLLNFVKKINSDFNVSIETIEKKKMMKKFY
jgi:hypothetical protein